MGFLNNTPSNTSGKLPNIKLRGTSNEASLDDEQKDITLQSIANQEDQSTIKLNKMLNTKSPVRQNNTIQYIKSMHHASRRNELMRI